MNADFEWSAVHLTLLLLLLPVLFQVYANVSSPTIPEQTYYLYSWSLPAANNSSSSSLVLSSSSLAVTQGVPAQVSVSCSGMNLTNVGLSLQRYVGIVEYQTLAGGGKQLIGNTAVVMQPL
jgi:hypothetical protein